MCNLGGSRVVGQGDGLVTLNPSDDCSFVCADYWCFASDESEGGDGWFDLLGVGFGNTDSFSVQLSCFDVFHDGLLGFVSRGTPRLFGVARAATRDSWIQERPRGVNFPLGRSTVRFRGLGIRYLVRTKGRPFLDVPAYVPSAGIP